MKMIEIRQSDKDTLTAQEVSEVLGCHPQWLRNTAREHPERIGFPFMFSGCRMIIPRTGFVNWFDGRL